MHIRSHGSRRPLASLVLASALAFPGPLWAGQPKEPSRADVEERLRRLEQIIREHGLDQPPAAKPAPGTPPLEPSQIEQIVEDKLKKQKVLAGWKDGFFLESPSGDFKLKVRGYLQVDARFFPLEQGDTGTDSFFLRRVRPILEGTVYKHFDFRLMPDFGEGKTTLQHAYTDVKYWPYAKFRAGKYKVPLSLERLQSGADLLFVERAISQNLAPNRDVGFQLSGDLLDGRFTYQLGGFNGVPDGGSADGDTTSDKEVAARLFAQPFKTIGWGPLAELGFGIAGTFGGQKRGDNLSGLAYKTSGRSTFFKFTTSKDITVVADGDRSRFSPQGYWYWGPTGLMGEYTTSEQGVRRDEPKKVGRKTVTTTRRDSFTNDGWFVQGSYVLTGENASYRGVVPINPFDPRQGRWGAFEIALRGGMVDVDEAVFAKGFASLGDSTPHASAYGAGLNWYLNRNFKFQLNYERAEFDNEIKFGKDVRDHEDVVLGRFQVQF
jgi:phosphate-selective porin OprO/OprP